MGFFLRAYQRFGREPQTEEVGRYYREPAEEIPPGLVPYVLSQGDPGQLILGRMIAATLLDFARRGAVELLHHENPGMFGQFAGSEARFRLVSLPNNATGLETEVWNLLRAATGDDGVLCPEELKNYFLRNPGLLASMSRRPRAAYEAAYGKLLDAMSRRAAAHWGGWLVGLGFMLLLTSFILGPILLDRLGGAVWAGILLGSEVLGGTGLMAMGLLVFNALGRWVPGKLLNSRRWHAYRNFLSDFSQMESATAEHFKIWDYHFVYAASLGVAERYLRNLRQIAQALRSVFAIADAYPELKADANFRELQGQLEETKNKIAYSRQFFNNTVLDFNNTVTTIPGMFVAQPLGKRAKPFFGTEEATRQAPKVGF